MKEGWEEVNEVLYFQDLSYVSKIIYTELISWHHKDLLFGHFGIEKIQELVAQKYYWSILHHNVKTYVKSCDIYLTSNTVRHKPYGDLQSLPMPTHCWKNLSIDFVFGLLISTN